VQAWKLDNEGNVGEAGPSPGRNQEWHGLVLINWVSLGFIIKPKYLKADKIRFNMVLF
jgi:hypothetical protein